MIAIERSGEHTNGEFPFAFPIWNEELFERHSRILSLPSMHRLLVHMDRQLHELMSVSADPAERANAHGLMCRLQPLAAFLGYTAFAEVACPDRVRTAANPIPGPDTRSIVIAALTLGYVKNMLANLPSRPIDNE